ncbi:unnamed protein product [Ostreobium quekettii]|uniref:Uncharacterized protein n=1 Tax=Ostreobium quekettii TaxID=121088 RepID=A0A8S1IQ33_9CHLO|nr:unnamed protein product [Ostreobium quekettii]
MGAVQEGRCFAAAPGLGGGSFLELRPFEGEGLWVEYPSDEEAAFEEAFNDFERMWADKWHGKDDPSEASPLAVAAAHSSIVEVLLRSLTSLSSRLKGSPPQPPGDLMDVAPSSLQTSSSWDDYERRGLFSSASWRRMFSAKPSGPKCTKSGPCELFADWPIPPYPEDYDWDD